MMRFGKLYSLSLVERQPFGSARRDFWIVELHDVRLWGLTFDMSGGLETAQLAQGCPLDGVVRRPQPEELCHAAPNGPLCSDFDVLDLALREGNGNTIFAHAFKVEGDGFPDFSLRLGHSDARSDASRQIRDVRGVVAFGLLDDDRVAHMNLRT